MKEEESKRGKKAKKPENKDRLLKFFLFTILLSAFLLLFFYIRFPLAVSGNFVKTGTGPYTYYCSNCSDCNAAIVNASSGDVVYLNNSINTGESICLNFTGRNGIIFSCGGNIISGSSGNSSSIDGALLVSSSGIGLYNCTFAGFYNGIYLFSSNSNNLVSLNTTSNVNGINAYSSNSNLLAFIDSSHNTQNGIYFYSSNNNVLSSISTNSNSADGINCGFYSNNSILTNINSNYNLGNGVNLSYGSSNSTLTNVNTSHNTVGIYIDGVNSTLTNIYTNANSIGVTLGYGRISTTLKDSHIENNYLYGLSSYLNLIHLNDFVYNDYFNNSNNVLSPQLWISFNTTKTLATNIIGGPYKGGNYWATPTATGFSQTCTNDSNNDYICDYPYNITATIYDYLPLIYNTVNVSCTENWTCINWTACNINGTQTRTCTDSNSCGTNANKPALNQTCVPCIESWTCGSWGSCTNGGQIRTCTDSNSCGTTYDRPVSYQLCNATTTINPSASGGGGGGTGASGTTGIGTNITQNLTTASPSAPAIINVNDSQIYLTKITLNVLNNIQSASITVTKVNVLADANLAAGLPSGQFYQAFRINTTGVGDSNIANVTIQFKVNKQWLASQSGIVTGIELYRRADTSSSWNGLTTQLTNQDDTYYYFDAVSPGFSTFAVFFNSNAASGASNNQSTPFKLNWSILLYALIVVVGGAIIFVVYYLLKRVSIRKEDKEKAEKASRKWYIL